MLWGRYGIFIWMLGWTWGLLIPGNYICGGERYRTRADTCLRRRHLSMYSYLCNCATSRCSSGRQGWCLLHSWLSLLLLWHGYPLCCHRQQRGLTLLGYPLSQTWNCEREYGTYELNGARRTRMRPRGFGYRCCRWSGRRHALWPAGRTSGGSGVGCWALSHYFGALSLQGGESLSGNH